MTSRYDDIINFPHHVSPTRQRMSMHDRAAQFAPFAALVGYDDAVAETARLTEVRPELDGQEQKSINERLAYIATALMGFLLLGWCGDWENEIIEFLKNVFLSSLSIFSFIIILLFIFSVICKVLSRRK